MGRQIISGGTNNNFNATNVEFCNIRTARINTWVSNLANREELVGADCKFHTLLAKVETAPGAGNSVTFEVMVNGASSGLSVTISGMETSNSSDATVLTLNESDSVTLRSTPVSSPTVSTSSWCLIADEVADDGGTVILGGTSSDLPTTSIDNGFNYIAGGHLYLPAILSSTPSANMLLPIPCTVKNWFVKLTNAPGVGESRKFAIQKNDVDTTISVTILGTATTGSDTSNSVAFSANDKIRLDQSNSVSPAAADAKWGIQFNLDDEEKQLIMMSTQDLLSKTDTEFNAVTSSNLTWNATEANRRTLFANCRIISMHVELPQRAATAGGSYAFTLMKDGVATAMNVIITGATNTGNDTTNIIEIEDFNELSYRCVPTAGGLNDNGVMITLVGETAIPGKNTLMMLGHGQ